MTTPDGRPVHAPPPYPVAPPARRRPIDILGIIGVAVAAVGLVPSLLVLLVGFIPSWNAIWWLGLALIPILAMTGVLAVVLGAVGIIVAVRRRGRYILSIIAVALGLVSLLPFAWLWIGNAG